MTASDPSLTSNPDDAPIEEQETNSSQQHILGQINNSIFAYITPLMIVVAIVITFVVGNAVGTLAVYFNTSIYLNGLIISLIFISLFTIFYNNYNLYRTAQFMKKIERIMRKPVIHDEDVAELQRSLEKEISLLNTKQMQDCLSNLSRFGHPNFTDKDAMLIKSKLGARMSVKRASTNFNSGILVMLGLLGTFLGLLKTIDAVGEALNSMSNIGGDGGEITMETMSTFIGTLAAPLQGMGLAFSSSLFGLSGSLLVGFFGHLSMGAQNNFIEDASRWIDNRIPKFNPDKSPKDPLNKQANQDDLKHWLTGYVHLSVKTNKQIAHLSQTILNSLEQQDATRNALTAIANTQENLTQKLDDTIQSLQNLDAKAANVITGIAQSQDSLAAVKDAVDTNTQQLSTKLDTLPSTLSNTVNSALSTTLSVLTNDLNNAVTAPLSALFESNLTHLGQAIEQGNAALLTQLRDYSAFSAIEGQINETRSQLSTAEQSRSAQIDAQTATITHLQNNLQSSLSNLQIPNTQKVEHQLSDIHAALLTLGSSLEAQSEIIANMPPPTITLPSMPEPLRATPMDPETNATQSSTDTRQLKEDAQSMLDDIEKDENNFFKNFFGIKPNKKNDE